MANILVYHIYPYHNYSWSYLQFSIQISSAKLCAGNDLCDLSNDFELKFEVVILPYLLEYTSVDQKKHIFVALTTDASQNFFNPHSTDIFYRLIIPCGVRLDPRPRFNYLHLPKWNRLFAFTLHIILDIIYLTYHMNENQKSATPANLSNFSVI